MYIAQNIASTRNERGRALVCARRDFPSRSRRDKLDWYVFAKPDKAGRPFPASKAVTISTAAFFPPLLAPSRVLDTAYLIRM